MVGRRYKCMLGKYSCYIILAFVFVGVNMDCLQGRFFFLQNKKIYFIK